MSFWRDEKSNAVIGTELDPKLLKTQEVPLVNDGEKQARLLSVYTYTMEQLQQALEEKDERSPKRAVIPCDVEKTLSGADADECSEGACRHCATQCLKKVNQDLLPYKLLYVFIRGGEACLTMYLSVFGLQIGLNPLQLSFVFALPLLISAFTTPLCGYISDKFRCRKEMLLLSLCLWVLFSLTVNFLPAPNFTTCDLARKQFKHTVAKVNMTTRISPLSSLSLSSSPSSSAQADGPGGIVSYTVATGLLRNFEDSHAKCVIPENITAPTNHPSWLSILHVISTPWTPATEQCYPGGRFWGETSVPGGISSKGPSTTYLGWIFEAGSLATSFCSIFALITVANVMQGPTLSLTDTATLRALGQGESHAYGWQKAFGNAGFAIYIILVTIFINVSSSTWYRCGVEIKAEDYRIAFVVFFGTTSCAVALLFAYCIKFTDNCPNESNLYNLKKVFCRAGPAALLPVLCYLSANEGAITVFLPFHLSILGSTTVMVKAARIISGISELFLAFHLGHLIQIRGHCFLLTFGTLGYLLCFLAYALINLPVLLLPVEILHGMSRALTWNVLVARLSVEVHPENLATLQGCLTGLYLLGHGLGAVVAGVGVFRYGAPITFFCFAFSCLVVGVLIGIASSRQSDTPKRTGTIRYKQVSLSESDEESDYGEISAER